MCWADARFALAVVAAACRAAPVDDPERSAASAPAPEKSGVVASSPSPAPAAPANTPNEVQRAAVEAACKELGEYRRPVRCEGTHYLGDFIVLQTLWKSAVGHGLVWYVSQRSDGRYRLLQTGYDPPGGGEVVFEPDAVCDTDAPADGRLPPGAGLVRAEVRDLNLDERPDLLVECRSDTKALGHTEGHYLRYCPSSGQACEETIWLRRVRNGHLEMDVDVNFADGWLLRTVRVFEDRTNQGNKQLSNGPAPRPNPNAP